MDYFNSRSYKASLKRSLINKCNELGIAAPDNARVQTLKNLLLEYLDKAVVVSTKDGFDLRRTDEAVKEYSFDTIIRCTVSVKAVSEEAARAWVEGECEEMLTCSTKRGLSFDVCDLEHCELIGDEDTKA